MPWSGIASHTTKEWFRTSQNEKWSHETEQTNTMEFKKECSWYVLILLILARGCRPFSHFRLPNSTMALSNLSPSLLLSWSKGLGNVSPLSAKGTPTPTVLMASSPWSTLPWHVILWLAVSKALEVQVHFIYIWLPSKPGADMSYKVLLHMFNKFLNRLKERKNF